MIQIEQLQKILAHRTALDIDALAVASGEVTGVTGTSGSGIEILFDLLTGRQAPSAGTIRLAGADPWLEKGRALRLAGVLFTEDALYTGFSPLKNLEFHCQLYGLPRARAAQVLHQLGLADQARASTKQLSSGLLRRLAFGRAILHSPPVLVLQEPFARCDEQSIELLSHLIHAQAGRGAAALILASNPAHLSSLCDQLYTLQDGRLSPADVQPEGAPVRPFKIPVRTEDTVLLLNPADILYAEAAEGRACVITSSGPVPTQFTLTELEGRLARSGFFRAHRSYLVNLQHIQEIIPYTRNSFSLRMDDAQGTKIPLSKAAAGELKELLDY